MKIITRYTLMVHPSFIRSLKMLIGEPSDYGTVIEQAKKTRWNWQHSMVAVPVHFSRA